MTPWAVTDLDPERAAAELARRFPGCCVWLGEYTGRWWALARDRTGDRLVEAADPVALGRLLEEVTLGRPEGAAGRDRYGRYSRASLQTPGRAGTSAPRTSRPAGRSRPPSGAVVRARRAGTRGRGGWLRRVLGSLVVADVP